MKKRLLMILVAAVMVVCAIPMSVSADGETVMVKDTYLADGRTYTSTDGIGITAGTVKCVYESDGSATLFLDGAEIAWGENEGKGGSGLPDLICSTAPKINIVLTGDNKLSYGSHWDKKYCIRGNDITLSGTGSLDLYSYDSYGIYSKGYLTIEGVTITGKTKYSTLLAADKNEGDNTGVININGASVIDVEGEIGSPLYAYYNINFNLTSGGSVKAVNKSTESAIAVFAYSTGGIKLAANNVITLPENGVLAEGEGEGRYYTYIAESASSNPAGEAVVEYVGSATEETKKAGANTGDSNDIVLFAIMGIIALCGAGFVYKKREN